MLLIEIGAAVSLWDLLGKGKHSKAPVGEAEFGAIGIFRHHDQKAYLPTVVLGNPEAIELREGNQKY
jgi:hypothetical protein